jgi:vancomycin resistance protein VanW
MKMKEDKQNKKNWPQKLATLALFATPIFLLAYYFNDHPYKAEIARRTVSLSHYSREQRLNFITAARALDGAVIEPGQTFSFNAKVGPRTGSRGFVPAGSYLGGSRVSSEGGGICLVSSCLYQAALLSGLKVKERAAHTTCVRSVAPGLDATVWYGKADLKLVNAYKQPVQIRCDSEVPGVLAISIYGTEAMKDQAKSLSLRRRELAFDGRNLLVEVYLEGDKHNLNKPTSLVSRDSYRLP